MIHTAIAKMGPTGAYQGCAIVGEDGVYFGLVDGGDGAPCVCGGCEALLAALPDTLSMSVSGLRECQECSHGVGVSDFDVIGEYFIQGPMPSLSGAVYSDGVITDQGAPRRYYESGLINSPLTMRLMFDVNYTDDDNEYTPNCIPVTAEHGVDPQYLTVTLNNWVLSISITCLEGPETQFFATVNLKADQATASPPFPPYDQASVANAYSYGLFDKNTGGVYRNIGSGCYGALTYGCYGDFVVTP